MIANAFPPGLILILSAVPAVLLRGRARGAWMLLVPVLSLYNMLALPEGNHFLLPFFRQELVLARVDRLSVVFGIIFHLIAFIANLYALKVQDRFQNAAGLPVGDRAGVPQARPPAVPAGGHRHAAAPPDRLHPAEVAAGGGRPVM